MLVLEESEQQNIYETLYKKSFDGFLTLKNGEIIDCDDSLLKLLKYTDKEKLLNISPAKLSPISQPDGKNSVEKANQMIEMAIKNDRHTFEWVHTKSTGEDFWAEVVLTSIHMSNGHMVHATCKDISKRKKTESELEELTKTLEDGIQTTLQELKNTQKIAKIGSWQYQAMTEVLALDDEAYNILDIDKNKFIITALDEFLLFVDTKDQNRVLNSYKRHLKDKKPYRITYKILTKAHNIKYIEERCETIFDDNGDPIISNVSIQDITEQQKVQLLMEEKDKQLQEQSRLAQMGEMISMIAHQWRQPLSAINSSIIGVESKLAIGKYDLKDEEDRDKFLKFLDKKHKNIIEYVQGLSETIDEFRNFFKPDKQKQRVSLIDPIQKALKIVEVSMSSKGIIIKNNFKNRNEIELYSNEIMQVILNILKNAEDNFVEKDIQNPTIRIDTLNIDNDNIIKITDNGGGIPKDILPNIFDPYFSTKDEKNGTGLGLYMSKTMIEDHHSGKLDVYNTNTGVCFEIKINIGK